MSEKLEQVQGAIATIEEKLADLTTAVAAEATQVQGLIATIDALREQIATGTAATPEQLEEVASRLVAIAANLDATKLAVGGIAPDAPAA